MLYTRRDFTRLAAASTAALALPAFPQQKKIRYAVIGLGRISLQHFMPGTRMSSLGQITALVCGHPEKARKYAADYNIPEKNIYTYENFDRIRDNPDVDAVYVALPNSMHAEYTIRAAKAGKHVLCEKPMATTVADSQAMIDACKQANKLLMIAYRLHVEPTTLHAQQIIKSGALGTLEAIQSANGFNIAQGEWRCNGKLAGGGPLMDVGIYSLNACRFLTGQEPASLSAFSSVIDHDGRFNEVEENLTWNMTFPSGLVASCATTYGANMPGYIRIHGSKGTLNVDNFNYQDIHLTARINAAVKGQPAQLTDDMSQYKDPAQFVAESDYFSKCILDGTKPEPSGEEGLRDMRIMMKIYESAKNAGAPIKL